MLLRHNADIKFIIKTAGKVNNNISSFSSAMCRVLSKYINPEEILFELEKWSTINFIFLILLECFYFQKCASLLNKVTLGDRISAFFF